jgi:hypothetical protein
VDADAATGRALRPSAIVINVSREERGDADGTARDTDRATEYLVRRIEDRS